MRHRSRCIRRHVFPLLSTRPIRDVSQGELREVVESLDGTVLDGVFSWRTAQKLWRCDLRATGITWEALAGTDPPEIQLRSGHERCATTQ